MRIPFIKSFFLLSLLIISISITAQQDHSHSRAILFPDVKDFFTIATDLHQHTVLSDGYVWPNIRIDEANKDSLDMISLTEHLEYTPKIEDIPIPDRNRAFELASMYARPYDLMVINGAEITRQKPPGHINAVFIQDANKLLMADSIAAIKEANAQGAFVFWNHPDWLGQEDDAIPDLPPLTLQLIKQKLIHGIEVVNDVTYSDEVLQIALDHDLTIMGCSDIHGLIDWQFDIDEGGHRPVTLIFAEERTPESVKEALFAKRTVAYYKDQLIGREAEIHALLDTCLQIVESSYLGATSVMEVTIQNNSNALFILANRSDFTFQKHADIVMIEPGSSTKLSIKTVDGREEFDLNFEVLNAITAPNTHPEISFHIVNQIH